MKILIIEDELAIAEVEKAYIEREGYEAEIAQDGLDGLAKFRADSFDLVLLDLMLPGMAGTDVCREIRRSSNAPILMVTAKSGEDDIVAGLDAGGGRLYCKTIFTKDIDGAHSGEPAQEWRGRGRRRLGCHCGGRFSCDRPAEFYRQEERRRDIPHTQRIYDPFKDGGASRN